MSRRRRLRLLRTMLVLVASLALAVKVTNGGSGAAQPAPPSTVHAATTATPAVPVGPLTDPFQDLALRQYLAQHRGVTAAVYDGRTNQTWTYRPQSHQIMASIMKVDILATLLSQRQSSGDLDDSTLAEATGMIEQSDNDDAEDIWQAEGGADAVEHFNARIGLTHTTPNAAGYWGLSTTTAADQVLLLRTIALPNEVLSQAARAMAMALMRKVTPGQAWGVTAGLPPGARVAVKNGWLPRRDGWQVNSDGIVQGHGYDDVVSVMTRADPTEAAGIDVIEHTARLLWPLLRRQSR